MIVVQYAVLQRPDVHTAVYEIAGRPDSCFAVHC